MVYMPKNCSYMPEPSNGDHYTLLPLTGDSSICIGALSMFAAAKLTVASKHSRGNESALSQGPIWKNEDLITRGEDNQPLIVNWETVALALIKVAAVDQFMPPNCLAWTCVGYEPKYVNDAFAFKETVAEMQQHYDKEKLEVTEQKLPQPAPSAEDEYHKQAWEAALTPMLASKSSNLQVMMPEGVECIDPMKYRAFLGVGPMPDSSTTVTPKEVPGETATTASTGAPAQPPQGSAATRVTEAPSTSRTPTGGPSAECDPMHLYEVLGMMTNSLEHLEDGYFSCFNATVQATRDVLADLNEADVTYINTVFEVMRAWQSKVSLAVTDMRMDDCNVWDAKCNTIDEATMRFDQICETSRITCAKVHEEQCKAVKKGDAPDPVLELLDRVLEKTRVVANMAVEAFQKQF